VEHREGSISFSEGGYVVSDGLVDDLLTSGRPFLHRVRADRGERTDDERLPCLLLSLLDENPIYSIFG